MKKGDRYREFDSCKLGTNKLKRERTVISVTVGIRGEWCAG